MEENKITSSEELINKETESEREVVKGPLTFEQSSKLHEEISNKIENALEILQSLTEEIRGIKEQLSNSPEKTE